MSPEKLKILLPRIRWYFEDKPQGFRIHVYDLLKEFSLISNLGYPSVDPTALAVKLSEFETLLKVEHTDSSGPFHHMFERL